MGGPRRSSDDDDNNDGNSNGNGNGDTVAALAAPTATPKVDRAQSISSIIRRERGSTALGGSTSMHRGC